MKRKWGISVKIPGRTYSNSLQTFDGDWMKEFHAGQPTYLPIDPKKFSTHLRSHSPSPLIGKLPTAIYADSAASIWLAHIGIDRPGKSVYLASNDGRDFSQLLETGNRIDGETRTTLLEGIGAGSYRLERGAQGARLFLTEDAGEILLAGALTLVEPQQSEEIIAKGCLHPIEREVLFDLIKSGNIDAILNYGGICHCFYFILNPSISMRDNFDALDICDKISSQTNNDARGLTALSILADNGLHTAKKNLERIDDEHLASVAAQYESPLYILWARAKDGDTRALAVLGDLAITSEDAFRKILNLNVVWKTPGSAEILCSLPINSRKLLPWQLKALIKAGHANARDLLMNYNSSELVTEAKHKYSIEHLKYCEPMAELEILVRQRHPTAIDGLLELYADGNSIARDMIAKLTKELVLHPGLVMSIDLERFKDRLNHEPEAVLAVHRFHEDGHPNAAEMLRSVGDVQELLLQASEYYLAVCAIYALDRAGNRLIREGIDIVAIDKWKEEYNWRGHAKQEGREARDAMYMLAKLGNALACQHERVAIPIRAVKALNTLTEVSRLAKQEGAIVIVEDGQPSFADGDPSKTANVPPPPKNREQN